MISFLRHLFIPHSGNNHRSKLLHNPSLFILAIFVIALSALTLSIRRSVPSVLGIATNINVNDLLALTNQKRQEEGLAPLTLNDTLSNAAAQKAANMFENNYWAHNGPDGTTPWVFFQSVGYNYLYAGENLARDFNDSTGVIDGWMGSPSHRENMLSDKYNDIGFAVVNGTLTGTETTLVVEMFGRRQGEVAKAAPGTSTQESQPTPTAIAVVFQQQVVNVAPTIVPSPTPTILAPIAQTTYPQNATLVAGVTNKPLVDSTFFAKNTALTILLILIAAFVLDMAYIERRKIFRLVGHNADHVLFLIGLIGIILIFGKGLVL